MTDRVGAGVLTRSFVTALVLFVSDGYEAVMRRLVHGLAWLVAVDGSTFEVPDEADNVRRFGKPSNNQGEGAFSQCAWLSWPSVACMRCLHDTATTTL